MTNSCYSRHQKKREPPKSLSIFEKETEKISTLPGHVIDRVLSYLPVKDAVRTSILSKKWRYRWAMVPHLVFDSQCFPPSSEDPVIVRSKLVNIIDHVLLLHTGPISKFKLSHRDLQAVTDIDRWILHVSRTSIEEFILEIWKGQRYRIPSCLFSSKNLIHLELFNCLLRPPPEVKGFKKLKSLDLQHITMDQVAFENMISSCPLLERLTLMNFDGFSHLKIEAPNLVFFDVGGVFEDVTFDDTSGLSIIFIGLYVSIQTEINSVQGSVGNIVNFFVQLPSIQRLEVQSYFLKYLATGLVPNHLPVVLVDLTYLSMRINFIDRKENLAALCLLRSSPNLAELEMLVRPDDGNVLRTSSTVWAEDGYCYYTLDQLQTVRINGISGSKSALGFIKFVLDNAPFLEKMTIKPASIEGRWEIMREMLRYRRSSVHAEIIYLDP